MSLIGPVTLVFDGDTTDYGDFVTNIQRTSPAPVTVAGINRSFSDLPEQGYAIVLAGVEETLLAGSLWRYLHDNAGEKDVDLEWSTTKDGVSFTGTIAVIPDPTQGGAANTHGQFNITIPLVARPVIVDPEPETP